MDKTDALAISRDYLLRLKDINLNFSDARLFGLILLVRGHIIIKNIL